IWGSRGESPFRAHIHRRGQPPLVPKAAFQSPVAKPRSRAKSPLITLKTAKSGAGRSPNPAEPSQAVAQAAAQAVAQIVPSEVEALLAAEPVTAEVLAAEALTAETLATLFGQAELEQLSLEPVQPELSETAAASTPLKPIPAVEPPNLPRSKAPQLSTHQHHLNPMLPLGLLQDIGKEVVAWQQALQQIHQQIQSLYQEGPIIDGWLEKPATAGEYHLCGLDREGRGWRRTCPAEEIHGVSLAIARYRKLRPLLDEKQRLDHRIQRLSETLTVLRGHLRAY
ncbi:MAG: hypothetical protein HC824_04715, partial [Synechococcales cyanobacterium RM1_1_8]|nr:hypothetical protein [Synechococcales cyanobacterium RM1_1_8]